MGTFYDATTDIKASDGGDEEACLHVMQLVTSTAFTMTFKAALELNLFNIISAASPNHLSPTEIAALLPSSTPSTPSMVDRMLRLLSSYSIVTCSLSTDPISGATTRRYGTAPVFKYLAQNEDGVSLSAMGMLIDKVLVEPWYYLKDAVALGAGPDKGGTTRNEAQSRANRKKTANIKYHDFIMG